MVGISPMWERIKPFARKVADAIGYERTHIARLVANRSVMQRLDALPCESLDVLEVSAGTLWQQRRWGSFTEMNYPEHDICQERLDRAFDIIIADNVWEHLLHPRRAAQNVLVMLKPGGLFINITPFMIRHHGYPVDCTRWTELGMRHFLVDAGFDDDLVETGSWGNAEAVRANFYRWAHAGWRRRLPNDPEFPVTVWAFARKAGGEQPLMN